jgi:hypothetical protein
VEHENPCHNGQGPVSESIVAAMYLDLYDGSTNGMPSTDADTISISFLDIWKAMKDINLGLSRTVYDYYLALLARGSVTAQQWQDNFGALGLDEATMITHSSPSTSPPEPVATSSSDQINVSVMLNTQKLPEYPEERPWPPKNRMHRRIT